MPIRRYRRTHRRRMPFAKRVRKAILSTAEPKQLPVSIPITQMYHAVYKTHQLNYTTNMPVQGTGDVNRIGDQIYSTGWLMRLLIGQKSDRPNVTFLWWVVSVPKGSAYNYNNWFIPTTGNPLLDSPNRDFIRVIKRGQWKPDGSSFEITVGAGTQTVEYTFCKKIWIPYKKLIKFGPADGAQTHNDNDVHFIMVAYDAYGTLVTDNIAYFQGAATLYYRDP